MNRRQAYLEGVGRLEKAGIAQAAVDARLLLEYAAGITLLEYTLEPMREMGKEQMERYREAIAKREQRIPLQHITGEQEFMGLSFQVNEHVLIPRQDTEVLVEEALERLTPGMQVLDLCTGSGCIGISLEKIGRKQKKSNETNEFTASDVSPEALQVAAKNIQQNHSKVVLVKSDLFENLEGKFDMIVSNPPYIPTEVIQGLEEEVRNHDPVLALDGKGDGLYFYRRIISEGRDHLRDGGWLLFEIGHDQREAVEALMREAGYREIRGKKDLAGLDRVVIGRYYV